MVKQFTKQRVITLYRQALAQGIMPDQVSASIARHLKRLESAEQVEQALDQESISVLRRSPSWVTRFSVTVAPLLLMTVGVWLIGSAVLPIAGYYFAGESSGIERLGLKIPIPPEQLYQPVPAVVAYAQTTDELTTPEVVAPQVDYTDVANWFSPTETGVSVTTSAQTSADHYTLDIPKLHIKNAEVTSNGTDLNTSLVQYAGTAAPGEKGVPVIFGHSVLRQFYNPAIDNPRRYVSIFSYIMTLEVGDPIVVTYHDVTYTYRVISKQEVHPEDTYILAQQYDRRLLKLVTCVPEGTYLRRGVVTAELLGAPAQ